jgi:hypothetical protein
MKICGAVLIVLGFIGLTLGGVPYQSRENVARLGDFKMEITEKKTLPSPCTATSWAGNRVRDENHTRLTGNTPPPDTRRRIRFRGSRLRGGSDRPRGPGPN